MRLTRGNPLLAELRFLRMQNGQPLDELPEKLLLQERAERIVAALEGADLGTDAHLHVLCVATLIGGLSIAEQEPTHLLLRYAQS